MSKHSAKPIRYQKNGRKRVRDRVKSRITDSGKNRLVVSKRSNQYTTVMIVSNTGKVLTEISSKKTTCYQKTGIGSNIEGAKELGKMIGSVIVEKGLQGDMAFDRNGYLYHGRVKAVAEGAREAGVLF